MLQNIKAFCKKYLVKGRFYFFGFGTTIGRKEKLSRHVLTPMHVALKNLSPLKIDKINAMLFNPPGCPKDLAELSEKETRKYREISLTRIGLCGPTFCKILALDRLHKGNSFIGLAVVTTESVIKGHKNYSEEIKEVLGKDLNEEEMLEFHLVPSPMRENPFHADIVLNRPNVSETPDKHYKVFGKAISKEARLHIESKTELRVWNGPRIN